MKELIKAINKWCEKNNKNVAFIGSFFEFNKEGELKNDRMVAFGSKDQLEISLDALIKEIKKEKKDAFVNW